MRTSPPLTVRYADTDAQGVVFSANGLNDMDEADTAHLVCVDKNRTWDLHAVSKATPDR